MYEFQVYEALLLLLKEQNRRLRDTAEKLGIEEERLSAEVRDARQATPEAPRADRQDG